MTWRRERVEICVWQLCATSSARSLFSRGELISQPNFLVGSWAQTKPPLCWEGGKESNASGIADAESFSFSPCQKLPGEQQPLAGSGLAVSTKQVTKPICLFRTRQKGKRWDPFKAMRGFFVGLKAERRLARDYNFNSFFYRLTVSGLSVISVLASNFNW